MKKTHLALLSAAAFAIVVGVGSVVLNRGSTAAPGAALAGAGENDPRQQPPLVEIAVVKPAKAPERAFTGVISARVQSNLGFRVPGKVVERLVDVGQTVGAGQPLMRLD